MEQLTKKQERVLSFLREHQERKGYPPTVREIVSHFKMSGPHHAKKFLDILERKGYIEKLAKSSRAIRLLTSSSYRSIPVVGNVRAGTPVLALENIGGFFTLDRKIARFENTFLLRVEGDSMIDAQIKDGDLALVRPQSHAESGEIVVALIGEDATVKRFFKGKESIRLEPANPKVSPIVVKKGKGEVTILGKVVAIVRDMEGK